MNILVIKTKFIGDTILASAFFQALKTRYPNAQVTALVSPLTEQVLQHNPYIDSFILTTALSSHQGLSKWERLQQSYTLITQLKTQRFDTAYVLTRSFYSALLVFLSNIKRRVGLATDGRSFLLSHTLPARLDSHEYQANLKLLSAIEPHKVQLFESIRPQFFLTPAEKEQARSYLNQVWKPTSAPNKPCVFLHLSGTNNLRRWNTQAWIVLADRLVEQGYAVLWSGAASDASQMQAISQQLTHATRLSSHTLPVFMGQPLLPIRQLAALISFCEACISVDTGPMHVAAALSVPTIGLFGPGDTKQWSPVGYPIERNGQFVSPYIAIVSEEDLPCRPCHGAKGCERISSDTLIPQCMDGLNPEAVLAQFRRLMA